MNYKPNLLQKIISFFIPYNIETVSSAISGKLEVNLQYGNIVIDSPEANYSFGNLHIVFRQAIGALKLDLSKQHKVLILGFGAGSISQILHTEINLICSVLGVELDAEIIKLSKKYFSPTIFKRTRIVYQDAAEFMQQNTAQYDLVFVDLFVDTKTPEAFQQKSFYKDLKNSLNPNGQVLMNTMSENEVIKENWNTVFGCCEIIAVQGNEVLKFKAEK